jgi:hypothetical protein
MVIGHLIEVDDDYHDRVKRKNNIVNIHYATQRSDYAMKTISADLLYDKLKHAMRKPESMPASIVAGCTEMTLK